jgi:DNA-binding CsgD family transcriptional regulator
MWLWFLGEALSLFGEPDEAQARFTEALEIMPLQRERAFVMRGLGLLAFRAGHVSEAERLFRTSLAALEPFRDVRNLAISVEELACLAAEKRQWERAARLLGASAMLFDLVSTVPAAWWQIEPEQAAQRCRSALGDARYDVGYSLGWAMSVDRAVEYALEVDAGPESISVSTAGPLSERELQVARLVARGLSNRVIAETLVISQKTVESHVAHALAKLGLHSRSGLAVWAAQQNVGVHRADRSLA